MKKIISFETFILVFTTLLAVASLLNNSYFIVHDDQHIARLYLLDQAIRQGSIYPRWVGGLGFNFGYPLFNFYPPLIYYVAEFFHLIGFNLLWSLKLMLATGAFISSCGMYLLGKRYFDKRVGLLAAALQTFFFYRIVTMYIRGAWAEFFAMSILPFVFLGLDSLSKNKSRKIPTLFSLSIGFLVLAHPLIAFPTFFFIALFFAYYFFISPNRWLFLKNFCLSVFFGLSLSAFFWLPSLIEKQYTLVNTILTHELANYKIHFIYPFQLWFSPWGYGGSIAGPNDGMTFQLGKVHIFLALISICLYSIFILMKKKVKPFFIFLLFTLLFSLFMSLTYSQFIWDKISYLWYLQFPWRFLTFSGIFLSLVAASGIYYLWEITPINIRGKKVLFSALTLALILVTIYKYLPYSKTYTPKPYDEKFLTSSEEISWRVSNTSFEFSPLGIKTKVTTLGTTTIGLDKKDLVKNSYEILNKEKISPQILTIKDAFSKKEFKITTHDPFEFRLNTFNFPGWRAYINGKEIKIDENNSYKLITVAVPSGANVLSFIFSETPIRIVGDIISFCTVLILISYLYFGNRRNFIAKKSD